MPEPLPIFTLPLHIPTKIWREYPPPPPGRNYSAQPDLTLTFQIVLDRLCVGITAQFGCQMKDDELNFVTMNIMNDSISAEK